MISEVKDLLSLVKDMVNLVKNIKDTLPNGENREELESKLKDAERKARALEAGVAKELGYPLCRCDFPPTIMLETSEQKVFRCPKCNKVEDTQDLCETFAIPKRDYSGFI
ncbi:MAG: hypothetical protein CMI12_05070 [Oceanospirillum sp.]|nr:hypothetical protein [Oceanospirillum sp.]